MKSGSFVEIYFEGFIEETGELFDKSMSPSNKNAVIIVTGEKFLLPGLDEEIKSMNPGEERTIILPPDKAFGARKSDLVKILPGKAFNRNNVNPVPGTWIEIGSSRGKILSSSAGRVRVDLNHPLAGKTLRYNLKVLREVSRVQEQVDAVVFQLLGSVAEVKVQDHKATITAPELPKEVSKAVEKIMNKYIPVIDEIAFVVREKSQ